MTKEEKAIAPISEKTDLAEVKTKTEESKKDEAPKQTFGQVLKRIFAIILRFIIIVAVLAGIAAAAYFGLPFLYERYIRPVGQNTSQLVNLKDRQIQSETQIADLQTRLATLEAGQAFQSDSITQLDSRAQTLEGADIERNKALIELTYQSKLLKTMELLSRARLFLYQSNFGLARQDVQVARDVLAELQLTAPESKQQDVSEALFRLDLVLKNLPNFPVAASDDLNIAWQILLDGYPVAPTQTPTAEATAIAEPSATSTPELTSTPTATP